jgi:hypothetical protein
MRLNWFHVSVVLTGLWVLLFLYIATQIGITPTTTTTTTTTTSAATTTSTYRTVIVRTAAPTPPPISSSKRFVAKHSLSPKEQHKVGMAEESMKNFQHELKLLEAAASVHDKVLSAKDADPWQNGKQSRHVATRLARTPAPAGNGQAPSCGLLYPRCTNDDELFVTYTQGGGFNNQRQSIERAFQVAMLLNRTLIVRDIWVDAKHNPGSNSTLAEPEFQPFDLFFDLRALRGGVPTVTEAELAERDPHLFAKRVQLRGIFKSDVHWIESVPCDLVVSPVRSITGKEMLLREQLFGIVEQLGCHDARVLEIGLVGMNRFWRTSERLRRTAARFVRLAPSIHHHAKQVWLKLMKDEIDPDTARPREGERRQSFVCIHYRQGDKLDQSPKEYNYTAQLIVDILKERRYVLSGEPVYVATDLPPSRFDLLAPFVREFGARMLATTFAPLLAAWRPPTNDYVAAIEVELCARARLFFGSSSTMSASIVNTRHGITGITDWETDPSTNFRLNRLSNEYKAAHKMQ